MIAMMNTAKPPSAVRSLWRRGQDFRAGDMSGSIEQLVPVRLDLGFEGLAFKADLGQVLEAVEQLLFEVADGVAPVEGLQAAPVRRDTFLLALAEALDQAVGHGLAARLR